MCIFEKVSIEHTWKNELKDLIWLEVTAWHAGRTATQQDIYLLAKRENVPNLLQKILDYKYIKFIYFLLYIMF